MAADFLNVDLEIEAGQPLDSFGEALKGSEVHSIYQGPFHRGFLATFECAPGGPSCDPDSIIQRFCEWIELFDEPTMSVWRTARRRTFDIGYAADDSSSSFRSELKAETLKRLSALDASVVVTIYPVRDEDAVPRTDMTT